MCIENNGGQIAIKGFNYQKAVIMLVLLINVKNKNFCVVPERGDDFEVHFDGKRAFIQVKGTKNITISKLTERTKGKRNSILDKSLITGEEWDLRGVFLWDFKMEEREKMDNFKGDMFDLPQKLYKFSDKQKERIRNKLALNDDMFRRLGVQVIYITPFINNLSEAIRYLMGLAIDQGFLGEAQQLNIVLSQLSTMIDKKSELEEPIDLQEKIISTVYVQQVFNKFEKDENFKEVLDCLGFNQMRKGKIKKAKYSISMLHSATKREVLSKIDSEKLITKTEAEAIEQIGQLIKGIDMLIEEDSIIALAIECYCEIGENII